MAVRDGRAGDLSRAWDGSESELEQWRVTGDSNENAVGRRRPVQALKHQGPASSHPQLLLHCMYGFYW